MLVLIQIDYSFYIGSDGSKMLMKAKGAEPTEIIAIRKVISYELSIMFVRVSGS